MLKIANTALLLLIVLTTITYSYSQSESGDQKKSQAIPIELLRNAKIVEDLIVLFPVDLEIVSCRISIVGNDIKYTEHVLTDHTLHDLFKNVHAGHWIFVEYILVKKKGSYSNAVGAFDPIRLDVVEEIK